MAEKLPRNIKKTHPFYSILAFLLGITLTIIFIRYTNLWPVAFQSPQHTYSIKRVQGYKYVKPVLGVEPANESTRFSPIKTHLISLIDSLKKAGIADEVSVYLREFERGNWIAINPEAKYHPASLMKVALMLCYLRKAEADPRMLEQKLLFEKPAKDEINAQFYPTSSIESRKSYSIHDLLYYMIANSDNEATWLLASHFDYAELLKLFQDFGLPKPELDETKFTISPKEYSYFFQFKNPVL